MLEMLPAQAETGSDMPDSPASSRSAAGLFLVVNGRSGNGATGRRWSKLARAAQASLGAFEVGFTEGPMHAAELTRQALAAGYRTILAVGGDGTLNEVVNGFFRPDGSPVSPGAAVGILPRGTGSDFCRGVGVPADWAAAVRHVAAAPERTVDVGRVRYRTHDGRDAVRYFLNVASLGVSGAVVDRVNRSSKRLGGRLSFLWASFRALMDYRDAQVRVRVDGGAQESMSATALAMCNGQFFGGGMWVAPGARLDDGFLNCTLWSGYRLSDFVLRSKGLYSGVHVGWSRTRCFTARRVDVESDERVLLDVDGEQPGTLPATFEILPGALRLKA